jgi:mgtE-like transporter
MAQSPKILGGLRPGRLLRRLVDLLGPTGGAARQSLIALGFNSLTSFAAGLMLVGFQNTWRALPPMLLLVPAAIGLRGNVFSALGNRLSTSIHTGAFVVSRKAESVLGQNLIASFTLTATMSTLLALIGTTLAVVLDLQKTISLFDIVVVSVVGGLLGSLVVAIATVALTMAAVRYGWDLDNLVAPSVSTLGDVLTIPALWVAAQLVTTGNISSVLGAVLAAATVGVAVWSWRSKLSILREIFRESLPVLSGALVLSTFAGVVMQKQLDLLQQLPTIWVLQPAFVSSAGALGGILCGRVSTGLHVGSIEPTLAPGPQARQDMNLVFGLAVPLLLLNIGGAWATTSLAVSDAGPSFLAVLEAGSIAWIATLCFVAAISYLSTIGAWRFNLDPDSFGIPLVTASVDFVGTMALVFAVVALGYP